MKTLIIILALLLCPVVACAQLLVCDPQTDVTEYQGLRNGTPFTTPYSLHASGAAIIFDVGTVGPEVQNFTEIKACNIRGCSTIVTFVVPGVPSSPSNIRLVQ